MVMMGTPKPRAAGSKTGVSLQGCAVSAHCADPCLLRAFAEHLRDAGVAPAKGSPVTTPCHTGAASSWPPDPPGH